jgi:hypothetical protein
MKHVLAITVLLAFSFPLAASEPASAEFTMAEYLYGMTVGPEGVEFQVYSGGCTGEEDFRLERFESFPPQGQIQLLLIRVSPDLCLAYLPYGTKIKFTYEDLGLKSGDSFAVLNPRAAMTVKPR